MEWNGDEAVSAKEKKSDRNCRNYGMMEKKRGEARKTIDFTY